jgi:hypothetical protein
MSEARRRRRADERAAKSSARQSPGQMVPEFSVRSMLSGRALFVSLALIAVNLIVYFPVRHYDFLSYDDPRYVIENPNVYQG